MSLSAAPRFVVFFSLSSRRNVSEDGDAFRKRAVRKKIDQIYQRKHKHSNKLQLIVKYLRDFHPKQNCNSSVEEG